MSLGWIFYCASLLFATLQVHPRTGHGGPEGEQMYSFTLPLTSTLHGVGGQRHTSAALPPGKTWYPLYRRVVGPRGWSGNVRKISPSSGIRSPNRPVLSEALYRLSYRGPQFATLLLVILSVFDVMVHPFLRCCKAECPRTPILPHHVFRNPIYMYLLGSER